MTADRQLTQFKDFKKYQTLLNTVSSQFRPAFHVLLSFLSKALNLLSQHHARRASVHQKHLCVVVVACLAMATKHHPLAAVVAAADVEVEETEAMVEVVEVAVEERQMQNPNHSILSQLHQHGDAPH